MNIPTISKSTIENKTVLLRTDYNVSIDINHHIANNERITKSIPTITLLLKNNNKIRIFSHLGRPKGIDKKLSLKIILPILKSLLPDYEIIFIEDYFSEKTKQILEDQTTRQIILFENIRFYTEEEINDATFSKKLSTLGEIFVNDAFSVSHRKCTSIVGIPAHLPSYMGLYFEKEIVLLSSIMQKPKRPFVCIIGGGKIDKIALITKLSDYADVILIGGVFIEYFKTIGQNKLQSLQKKVDIILPIDSVKEGRSIVDIGPKTCVLYSKIIKTAKTILWNGPMGIVEKSEYKKGTISILDAISENKYAVSVIGGGDTITAISHNRHKSGITHISTAGGAMLTYIERGTLPGIDALIMH